MQYNTGQSAHYRHRAQYIQPSFRLSSLELKILDGYLLTPTPQRRKDHAFKNR